MFHLLHHYFDLVSNVEEGRCQVRATGGRSHREESLDSCLSRSCLKLQDATGGHLDHSLVMNVRPSRGSPRVARILHTRAFEQGRKFHPSNCRLGETTAIERPAELLQHDRLLWFWIWKPHAIPATRGRAYAHIQRMVTEQLAAAADPDGWSMVHLGVPSTRCGCRGMSQFTDRGVWSKPYVSSANYAQNGPHCASCRVANVKPKPGLPSAAYTGGHHAQRFARATASASVYVSDGRPMANLARPWGCPSRQP